MEEIVADLENKIKELKDKLKLYEQTLI